jgi:hypothetical protein
MNWYEYRPHWRACVPKESLLTTFRPDSVHCHDSRRKASNKKVQRSTRNLGVQGKPPLPRTTDLSCKTTRATRENPESLLVNALQNTCHHVATFFDRRQRCSVVLRGRISSNFAGHDCFVRNSGSLEWRNSRLHLRNATASEKRGIAFNQDRTCSSLKQIRNVPSMYIHEPGS